jgi:hypothetical protein
MRSIFACHDSVTNGSPLAAARTTRLAARRALIAVSGVADPSANHANSSRGPP